MRLPERRGRAAPDLPLARGERLLAWSATEEGVFLGGTREALYLPTGRVPWQEVEAADFDAETRVLRVAEVGSWGEERREHRLTLEEPGRFVELVRERVTASVVIQRHVPVRGRRGLRVIGRRPPHGPADITWFYEYDEGVDPDDPTVRLAAEQALDEARAAVGDR